MAQPRSEPKGPAPFVADPDTGGLPRGQLHALLRVLERYTTTSDQCFIGCWEGYGWPDASAWVSAPRLELDQRAFLVREGPIGLVDEVGRRSPEGHFFVEPPTIVWPADRAWFVASDPDLDSTYVGGSAALIAELLECAELEAWAVAPDDLVAIVSDEINAAQ
jgi:hypothetical protein